VRISGQRWVDKFKMAQCNSSTPHGGSLRRGGRLRGMVAIEFSVFMRRSRISKLKTTFPSEVLVESDKISYRNLTFDNVIARLGSSFCYRARLNFQGFSLRDMKWRLAWRVGQKMSHRFSFC